MSQDQNNQGTGGETLYAGKYKTVQELEEGYKLNSKAMTRVKELETELEGVKKVPDDYNTPTEIALHEADLAETKRLAKESGMTQAQYEKFVRQQESKSKKMVEDYEAAKKEVGADNLNILQDYVDKYYPEKLRPTILKNLIKDKEARAAALEHRQQLLNNRAPGMNKPGAPFDYRVTYDDVIKAREAHQKQKGNMKLRKRYLDLTAAYAHQKDND